MSKEAWKAAKTAQNEKLAAEIEADATGHCGLSDFQGWNSPERSVSQIAGKG